METGRADSFLTTRPCRQDEWLPGKQWRKLEKKKVSSVMTHDCSPGAVATRALHWVLVEIIGAFWGPFPLWTRMKKAISQQQDEKQNQAELLTEVFRGGWGKGSHGLVELVITARVEGAFHQQVCGQVGHGFIYIVSLLTVHQLLFNVSLQHVHSLLQEKTGPLHAEEPG